MIRMRHCIVSACLVVAIGGHSGALVAAQYGDAVVAVVESEILTVYDLQEFAAQEEIRLQGLYAGDELRDRLVELRKAVAQRLIDRELIYAEFKALAGKVPLTILQERMDEIILRRSGGDRRRFEALLAAENMTMAEFEGKVRKQLSVDLLLNERVYRHRDVKPSEVEAYYRDHAADLAEKAGFRLRSIMLKKEGGKYSDTLGDTIREILGKLKTGTPFGELARTYSEGPRAEEGGDQGWISSPSGKLKDTLAGMAVGDVTDGAIDLGSNMFIIKLADRRDAGIPALDDPLRQRIETILREANQAERYKTFLQELRAKYYVKTPEDFDTRRE